MAESDDERVARSIRKALAVVSGQEAPHALIGSCGLQSYCRYFHRLPNDLDLVVPEDAIEVLLAAAERMGYQAIRQLGRAKMIVDGFPVHLLPQKVKVIDTSTSVIFAEVDLSGFLSAAKSRRLRLLQATSRLRARVFPIEAILAIELIRPIYTGSVFGIGSALAEADIDPSVLRQALEPTSDIMKICRQRARAYPQAIKRAGLFSTRNLAVIQRKLDQISGALS